MIQKVLIFLLLVGGLALPAVAQPQMGSEDDKTPIGPPVISPEDAMRMMLNKEGRIGRESPVTEKGWHDQLLSRTWYMLIPIVGTFGEDVLAPGVEAALSFAAEQPHIDHVVFYINSPGGQVQAADDIREAMFKYGQNLQYHAIIEQAISAAIWVVFSCDTIHMIQGSSVGGAVAYTIGSTGSAQVDVKMNSILTAQMAAAAEAKGHPPALARAMILVEKQVYAWKDAKGRLQIGSKSPEDKGATDIKQLDTSTGVLTLTKDEAVSIGFAKPLRGKTKALGSALGVRNWTRANDYGHTAMLLATYADRARRTGESWTDEAVKEEDMHQLRISRTAKALADDLDQAIKIDPERFMYFYDPQSRKTIVPSVDQWGDQVQEALDLWRGIIRKHKRIQYNRDAGVVIRNNQRVKYQRHIEFVHAPEFLRDYKEQTDRVEKIQLEGYPRRHRD